MLIKQGACAIKTGKWGLMATPPAASAISLPFRTRRRRYITTLIWAALHHSFRKHFYNFSPLAPTPLSHCAPFPPPPTKVHNGSVLRRTVGPVTEEGVVSRWGGGAASSRRVYQGDDAALSVLLNVAPPFPPGLMNRGQAAPGVWWRERKRRRRVEGSLRWPSDLSRGDSRRSGGQSGDSDGTGVWLKSLSPLCFKGTVSYYGFWWVHQKAKLFLKTMADTFPFTT